jgi:hypothetical protein
MHVYLRLAYGSDATSHVSKMEWMCKLFALAAAWMRVVCAEMSRLQLGGGLASSWELSTFTTSMASRFMTLHESLLYHSVTRSMTSPPWHGTCSESVLCCIVSAIPEPHPSPAMLRQCTNVTAQ